MRAKPSAVNVIVGDQPSRTEVRAARHQSSTQLALLHTSQRTP